MAEYKEILYEKQRKGVLITLNRPEAMNALSRSLLKELHQALDEAEADPHLRFLRILVSTKSSILTFAALGLNCCMISRTFSIPWASG